MKEKSVLFNWKSSNDIIKVNSNGIQHIIEKTLHNAIEITDNNIINCIDRAVIINDDITITGNPATNLVKCYQKKELSFGKRASPTHSEILDYDKSCKTIICTYGRMPRLFVPLKNSTKYFLRELTVTELQQIQGFPPNFIFTGNTIQQITQIGNAIPPPVICNIVNSIISLN